MDVRTVASTLVQPKIPTPRNIISMSNMDHVQISNSYTKSLYFYKADGSTNFFSFDILTEALSAALVPFYPVAGRLQRDAKGRPEINCNGAGVLLVKAAADTRIEDQLRDFVAHRPEFWQLIPEDPTDSPPLAALQVTVFQCGGVSLGVGVSHQIGDGLAWLHFVNTWADLARGVAPKVQPLFDRTPLKARSPPTPMFPHVEYQPPPQLIRPPQTEEPEPANKLADRTFTFSREILQELKACGCQSMSMVKYTTYEMLAAHIWRCLCEVRELSPDQETMLRVPVDGRSRLSPPLPEGYFGNAIFMATPMLKAGDVMAKPLLYSTAGKIHDEVAKMNDEYLRSAIDFLELVPDLPNLSRGNPTTKSPNLSINNWSKMPFYKADFGWGKPMLVTPIYGSIDGVSLVMPTPASDGSLTLRISMPAQHMLKFEGLLMDVSQYTHS